MAMTAYIQSIRQISIQEPLCEKWFTDPIVPASNFNEGIDPDFKSFLSPQVSRRMGNLFKRAIVTSASALGDFPSEKLGAIITGTGLGCIDNTEKFLLSMLDNGEQCLHPTDFMLSTHNTISSQIALHLHCNGYNNTYSHRGTSFDSAFLDAFVQMGLGGISTALVGGNDEMTPKYHLLLDKSGYWKKGPVDEAHLRAGDTGGSVSGICSLSVFLTKEREMHPMCCVKGFDMLYEPSASVLEAHIASMLSEAGISSFDSVVTGISGDKCNDDVYKNCFDTVYEGKPVLWYKHIFGESFCSSAFGLYEAAVCLAEKRIPGHLVFKGRPEAPRAILVHNHFQNKDHSLALLTCSD